MAVRCSCGNQLIYETDICPVCLPNGLMSSRAVRPNGLREIADCLGVVVPTVANIKDAIARIVKERNDYEELACRHCDGDETLAEHICRITEQAETAYECGRQAAFDEALAAIAEDREERQAYHAWDGMKRAASVVEELKAGKYQWVPQPVEDGSEL